MKDLICFLIFLIYSTVVFFFPNNDIILFFIVINLILFFIMRKFWKFILRRTFGLIPFVLFTFVFNCFFDTFYNAVLVGVKLIIVCNVTMIYSCTTSVAGVANTIKLLFSPLSFIGIDTEQIRIMVCISLSMIPIFKRDLYELRDTCVSKGIRFSVSNVKFVVSKFFFSILQMVSKIERALLAKGIDLS
jgi:energy-coupling factor transporter transmembrane protein EcfT